MNHLPDLHGSSMTLVRNARAVRSPENEDALKLEKELLAKWPPEGQMQENWGWEESQ